MTSIRKKIRLVQGQVTIGIFQHKTKDLQKWSSVYRNLYVLNVSTLECPAAR